MKRILFLILGSVVLIASCDKAPPEQAAPLGPGPDASNSAPATQPSAGGTPGRVQLEKGPGGRGLFPAPAAQQIMDHLVDHDAKLQQRATMAIISVGDPRFVIVLVDAIRAARSGAAPAQAVPGYLFALQILTQNVDVQPTPAAWTAIRSELNIQPPPGYSAWKGRLLGRLDPKFAPFFDEQLPRSIGADDVFWTGTMFDGLPALTDPKVIPAASADYMDPAEPVFGIVIGGEARAYPQRFVDAHEVVNDHLGGVPILLANDPIQGAAIAYDRRAAIDAKEQELTFGNSGLNHLSNKLIFDRNTRTLWRQIAGEPVIGPLVDKKLKLVMLPLVVARWSDWKADHPESTVLSKDTGQPWDYTLGAVYGSYFAAAGGEPLHGIDPKARMFVVRMADQFRAYPVEFAVKQRVLIDKLGGKSIVIVALRPSIEATGRAERIRQMKFNAGAEVRAYSLASNDLKLVANPGAGADASQLLDSQSRTWRVTEEALIGPDNQKLPRIPGHEAYWFGIAGHIEAYPAPAQSQPAATP